MMPNVWDVHQQAKQTKVRMEGRNMPSPTENALSVKLLTSWEFPLGQCKPQAARQYECLSRLLPNSCPAPAHSALSVHEFLAINETALSMPCLLTHFSTVKFLSFPKTKDSLKKKRI
jgi:hypothetical protein